MGKKNIISKTDSNDNKPLRSKQRENFKKGNLKNGPQRLKVIRRNPQKRRDFKSKPKTLKHSKLKEKGLNKLKSKATKIEEEEQHIELIENDNKLYETTGFLF